MGLVLRLEQMSGMPLAQILDLMAVMMVLTGLTVFVLLQFTRFKAAYGRYSKDGMVSSLTVPARFAWFVQESPSFIVPLYLCLTRECTQTSIANKLVVGLFMVHYFQRSFIYPLLIRGGKPTPIDSFLLALVFCTYNGFLQGASHCIIHTYPDGYAKSFRTFIGLTLFFSGMGINIHSDSILRNLRKPGETGYKIPRGGMFEFISGANYFGEIVEWIGFAIVGWSFHSAAFAFFTAANIGPRALHHHQYYKEKFDDYPEERKALIPFFL